MKYKPKTNGELLRYIYDLEIPLNEIEVSEITNMDFLFFGRGTPPKGWDGIEEWDVSNVWSMSYMFKGCRFFNVDISCWNTSNVKYIDGMFYECYNFNQPIGKWNVSNVCHMNNMFERARSFNQDLNSWDVSKVENMSGMFKGAVNFNGNISSWDVSNVNDMSYMFAGAKSFNSDISQWDVSGVSYMNRMFANAVNFNQDISSWNIRKLREKSGIFAGTKMWGDPTKLPNMVSNLNVYHREYTEFTATCIIEDIQYLLNNYNIFKQYYNKSEKVKIECGVNGIKVYIYHIDRLNNVKIDMLRLSYFNLYYIIEYYEEDEILFSCKTGSLKVFDSIYNQAKKLEVQNDSIRKSY